MTAILNSLIQNGYVTNINNVDNVYIILDTEWKKIAVSVSGGADSALLLFLLCDIIDKKQLKIDVNVITNIRMWKDRPWQRKNSIDVFNFIQARFTKIKFQRHENFIAPELEYGNIGRSISDRDGRLKSGDQISTISHAEYICHTYDIDAWFAGITKNPTDTNITSGMDDRTNEFDGTIEQLISKQNNTVMCHPFRFTDKRWIMRQYKNYKLDELLALTRSCEGDNNTYPTIFDGLDFTTYKDSDIVPECGQCFWCQERSWGIQNAE
jgi:7-cyano-7-deazaguanine synthase in queuosine biosynthesis